jgi:acetyl-CoA acetyltransferase family protein
VPQRKGDPLIVDTDEHPRAGSTIEGLQKLRPIVRKDGTVTAGNASGINDGSCAVLLASDEAVKEHNLEPLASVVAWASAGVEPRIMGIGPVPASRRVLEIADLYLDKIDVIELNEAFAAQGLAVLRELGIDENAEHVNPNGGAIALGHPLGMSGARLVTTAAYQLKRTGGSYALCTMCIGVGQGIAMIIKRA